MSPILLFVTGSLRAQEPYFPELVFLPKNKDVNSIIDDVTSVHLRAMNEPSLWHQSRKDRQTITYRFMWLHPGKPQVCIRLSLISGAYDLHVAGHDGPPGITAGKMIISKDLRLTEQEGKKLIGLIDKTAFWTSPVEVKENRAIADGDGIVVEGVRGGKYHIINRAGTAAGESYESFCRSLLELSEQPAVLKEWDRFRQTERRSPRYRAEPPQTEDLGDPMPEAGAP